MTWRHYIFRHAGWLAALWAAVIFVLCATPGQYLPQNRWLDLLSVDKLVHASVFFILCALLLLSRLADAKRFAWIAACIGYGILLEVMQATVFTNRSYDVMDMVANSTGVLAAALLSSRLRRWLAPAEA